MRPARTLGAAVLALVLVTTACAGSQEDSEEEIVDDVAAALQRLDDDLDEEAATCFAEIVVDEVGVEEARDLELTGEDPATAVQEQIATATLRANEECELGGDGG